MTRYEIYIRINISNSYWQEALIVQENKKYFELFKICDLFMDCKVFLIVQHNTSKHKNWVPFRNQISPTPSWERVECSPLCNFSLLASRVISVYSTKKKPAIMHTRTTRFFQFLLLFVLFYFCSSHTTLRKEKIQSILFTAFFIPFLHHFLTHFTLYCLMKCVTTRYGVDFFFLQFNNELLLC